MLRVEMSMLSHATYAQATIGMSPTVDYLHTLRLAVVAGSITDLYCKYDILAVLPEIPT
jgi:hypothetical protein